MWAKRLVPWGALAVSFSLAVPIVSVGMILPKEVKFIPGYYLATYSNGYGCVIEDPVYDDPFNVMVAKKVSTDGIDDDGGEIYIDMGDVRAFEPISLPKLEHIKANNVAKAQVQRINGQIELATAITQGQQVGCIQKPPEPTFRPQDPGSKSNKSGLISNIRSIRAEDKSIEGKIAPPSR